MLPGSVYRIFHTLCVADIHSTIVILFIHHTRYLSYFSLLFPRLECQAQWYKRVFDFLSQSVLGDKSIDRA